MSDKTEAARARRRAQIESALARYPHLSPEGVKELSDYFAREASALDVGLIASNEAIAAPYRAFRAAHVDPLRWRDWMLGTVIATAVGVMLAVLLWKAF
jgi:hypothetical protein